MQQTPPPVTMVMSIGSGETLSVARARSRRRLLWFLHIVRKSALNQHQVISSRDLDTIFDLKSVHALIS